MGLIGIAPKSFYQELLSSENSWGCQHAMFCVALGCTDAAPRPAHPRPTRRDAADAGGTPQTARPCRIVPRGDSRIGPTRLKLVPTRPKSGRLGPYRPYRPVSAKTAESGRNSKKKKKGAKRTVWLNLNTQTLTLRPKLPNTLSHSVPHLPSLCAPSLISLLCVLSSLWVLCAHCTASAIRCALSALFLNFYSLFFTISLFQIA